MKLLKTPTSLIEHVIFLGTENCFKKQLFSYPKISEIHAFASAKIKSDSKNTPIQIASNFFNTPSFSNGYLAIFKTKKTIDEYAILNAMGSISRLISSNKGHIHICFSDLIIDLLSKDKLIHRVIMGIECGRFKHKDYSKKLKFTLSFDKMTVDQKKRPMFSMISKNINTARYLMGLPSNELTPKIFTNKVKQSVKSLPVDIIIDEKKTLEEKKMNGILNVSKGSSNAPYLIELAYTPNTNSSAPHTVLIGKGVTFDSGGISIKPSRSMAAMKADMGGAAVAFATFLSLVEQKCKKNITLLLPLVENMPSGDALKPGDVFESYNKKKIEIINTDAEGRLILADCLAYASEQKPKQIIDIATLTGACSVALGDQASAILGNDQQAIDTLIKWGNLTGDRLWQLPLYDEFLDYLKSDVADIKNAHETRLAGTSTAAIFLQQFVTCKSWVHIDIASTMMAKKQKVIKLKASTLLQ